MIPDVIRRIDNEIVESFKELFTWLDVSNELMDYAPKNNGWSVRQNVEHVTLTNHYLLILIKKGTNKAIELAAKNKYTGIKKDYDVDWDKLAMIGKTQSFPWVRPEHMEPTGTPTLGEICNKLTQQQAECLECLHKLENGEGMLFNTMMIVNGLGKIDVYHYLVFLVRHMQRHIGQMQKIKLEFDQL